MAKPPLIFSGAHPGALFITKCCSASPSWDQLPVDLTFGLLLAPTHRRLCCNRYSQSLQGYCSAEL